jgi:hypothetical protein
MATLWPAPADARAVAIGQVMREVYGAHERRKNVKVSARNWGAETTSAIGLDREPKPVK